MSAPKSREMWAMDDWRNEDRTSTVLTASKEWLRTVRVRVEEIDPDEPAFEQGDRVGRSDCGAEARLVGRPFSDRGRWWLPIRYDGRYAAWRAIDCRKLPEHITRTIEVTGPEDAVEAYTAEETAAGPRAGVTVRVLP